MAFTDVAINKIIHLYIEAIAANHIEVEKVYLFGSYAHGTNHEDSDIDLAIVSKSFSGDRFDDRRRIVPLRRAIDRRLEPIPFNPENFKDNDPLVIEILNHGIEIK